MVAGRDTHRRLSRAYLSRVHFVGCWRAPRTDEKFLNIGRKRRARYVAPHESSQSPRREAHFPRLSSENLDLISARGSFSLSFSPRENRARWFTVGCLERKRRYSASRRCSRKFILRSREQKREEKVRRSDVDKWTSQSSLNVKLF